MEWGKVIESNELLLSDESDRSTEVFVASANIAYSSKMTSYFCTKPRIMKVSQTEFSSQIKIRLRVIKTALINEKHFKPITHQMHRWIISYTIESITWIDKVRKEIKGLQKQQIVSELQEIKNLKKELTECYALCSILLDQRKVKDTKALYAYSFLNRLGSLHIQLQLELITKAQMPLAAAN